MIERNEDVLRDTNIVFRRCMFHTNMVMRVK